MSGDNDGNDWCTIESDPGVFTELLEELGCSNVQLEELWSLDDDSLKQLYESSGAIYGLVFLFQWEQQQQSQQSQSQQQSSSVAKKQEALPEDATPDGLFFAHQVTTNACATQAILSVVLNAPSSKLQLGPTLAEFKDFTASFPPSLKGVSISSSEPIKKAHNAFGRTDAFLNDGKYVSSSRKSEDVFHFVAYIPKDNKVYELDGLQTGPIVVGEFEGDVTQDPMLWLSIARTAIQQRMQGDAIKFNLMAVIQDKRMALEEKVASNANSTDSEYYHQLEMEKAKRAQWKLENQRRRHNYVPLCVSMFKELARLGKLPKYVDEARERKRQKLSAAKK